jgi:probable F420-dependent oxidoreductase
VAVISSAPAATMSSSRGMKATKRTVVRTILPVIAARVAASSVAVPVLWGRVRKDRGWRATFGFVPAGGFPIKPFRFGVQLNAPSTGAQWRDIARRIEAHGYSVATMPDHFTHQLAPIPALQAVLDVTTTLRAGALVFANDYKHPAILAKELATMDVLSEGRVEIGLGAGWMTSDYEQLGMPYDRAGIRVDRFVEGLAVIRGAMGPDPFSFAGEHYRVTDYDGQPKPVQAPCPPILIGGGGKRVLTIAAREADIVGVNGTLESGVFGVEAYATMSLAAMTDKVAIVASAAGGRLGDIEMNLRTVFVSVTDDRAGEIARTARMVGVEEAMLDGSPFALFGSRAKIVEDLLARREQFGFSYIVVGIEHVDTFAPVVAELAGR